MFANSSKDSNILIKKKCEYVGSVKVPLLRGVNRQSYVMDRLMGMENVKFGMRVSLIITKKGVKTQQKKVVKLAHSLSHILFSSYFASNYLFAYVTKSYSPEQLIEGQAYVYKVSHSYDLKKLNQAMKDLLQSPKCFAIQRAMSCEEHYIFKTKTTPQKRNWAKMEHYQGHNSLEYTKFSKERKLQIRVGQSEKIVKDSFKITHSPPTKDNMLDIQEYVIIDDQFVIENEFYCLESYDKWRPKHVEFTDEFYSLHNEKVYYEGNPPRNWHWLLEKGTSQQVVEKKLLMESIGSYLVVPQSEPDTYLFTLRVPCSICISGFISCAIKKSEKGFCLEGFTSQCFESLLELVQYYGSVQINFKLHDRDHTDSCSDDHRSALGDAGLGLQTMEDIDDYECYESAKILNAELHALQSGRAAPFYNTCTNL